MLKFQDNNTTFIATFVKHFVVMVLIMENVLPKKKLITDIKYML